MFDLERRIGYRQLTEILALFMIVQFAGLFIATFSVTPVQVYSIGNNQGVLFSNPLLEALYYVVSIAIFAVLILAILRIYKNKGAFLFRIIEAFAVGFGTAAMFFVILSTVFYSASLTYTGIAAVILGALVVAAKTKFRRLRNFAALTSSIGLGVIIGAYGFSLAYLFMFVMAIYDYIAVFVTKHMLALAKAASNSNLSLLIGSSDVEIIPKAHADKKALAELKHEVKKNQIKDPIIRKVIESGELPVLSQIQLGAGDLTLPLVMSVGIFVSTLNYYIAVIAVLGAIAGLLVTMWLLKRYSVALPAIPPLFAVMNFFMGIGFLTYSHPEYIQALEMMVVGAAFMLLMILTLERNRNSSKNKSTATHGKPAQKP